jgi:N-methylhydantoinase B
VAACVDEIWSQSEQAVRMAVEAIPDGTYEAESLLDDDWRHPDVPIRVKVKVIVSGSDMVIDYSQMHPQVDSPMNSGRSGGIAAARVAFKALTSPHLDVNEGCFRPLGVELPEGTILSARPPAALGLWSVAMPTVVDTILKALFPAMPNAIPAAHKGDMGGTSFFGQRKDGSRFLMMSILGGGWGGRAHEDGADASVSVCQGDVRNTPVELEEIKYPFVVEQHALREDSGGAGQFRGGLGIAISYRCLTSCKGNINFDRVRMPPWGVLGGKDGAPNMAVIDRVDGSRQTVYKATELGFGVGDRVTFLTAGGGGYGEPRHRDKAAIESDVVDGLVSAEAASRDYGWDNGGTLK